MEEVIQIRYKHTAILKLNRPAVYNSINGPLALLLQRYLRECGEDPAVRSVMLTGEGKAFCGGQDLAALMEDGAPSVSSILEQWYNPIVRLISGIEKPVLAAVNGVAAGAGANIALACDLVVAASSASFIQSFSKIGLIPDSGGTYILPRLIGRQRAAALMFLGEKVTAPEAEKMGMIWKCLPDEDFYEKTLTIGTQLAEIPAQAVGYTKKLLQLSQEQTMERQLEAEVVFQAKAADTREYKEGVAAFLEKRKPGFTDFTGK